jgi:hypothetical protein
MQLARLLVEAVVLRFTRTYLAGRWPTYFGSGFGTGMAASIILVVRPRS